MASLNTFFNNSREVGGLCTNWALRFCCQMKTSVRRGSPAPTPATMPWGPITAPAPKASPSLLMEELVKVFIHKPQSRRHMSAKVMAMSTQGKCDRPVFFFPTLSTPPWPQTADLHWVEKVGKRKCCQHTAFLWGSWCGWLEGLSHAPQHSEERHQDY